MSPVYKFDKDQINTIKLGELTYWILLDHLQPAMNVDIWVVYPIIDNCWKISVKMQTRAPHAVPMLVCLGPSFYLKI